LDCSTPDHQLIAGGLFLARCKKGRKMTKKFYVILCSIIFTQQSFARDGMEQIGDYFQVIVPAYALGMGMKESDYAGAKQFLYSFGAASGSVFGLKSVINEDRPDHSNKDSFPSGHTAAAFTGATFIHKRYGIKPAIIPYFMAGFTGYTRIQAKKHYLHDVLAGAAISTLWTWILVDKERDVRLNIGSDGIGLSFRTEF
jgi:hypothetical protein